MLLKDVLIGPDEPCADGSWDAVRCWICSGTLESKVTS